MRRSRLNEEQVIGILKEHQAGLGVAEPRFNLPPRPVRWMRWPTISK